MLRFVGRWRQQIAAVEREADHLMIVMGEAAYATAQRMERESNDFWTMRYWVSVQAVIARKVGKPFAVHQMPHAILHGPAHDAAHCRETVVERFLLPSFPAASGGGEDSA